MTCDVWASSKDQIGEERKPPANFDLIWDDVLLSAKLAFDGFDEGDTGLITPEAMLEVSSPVWQTKPSQEPFTTAEQVKLSEELLNYRQRRNNGLMSFEDLAAWHARIPQALAGIRSLKQKQRAARDAAAPALNTPGGNKPAAAQPTSDPLASIMSSIGDTLSMARPPGAPQQLPPNGIGLPSSAQAVAPCVDAAVVTPPVQVVIHEEYKHANREQKQHARERGQCELADTLTYELIPAAFIPTFQDCAETGYGKLLCLLLAGQGRNKR